MDIFLSQNDLLVNLGLGSVGKKYTYRLGACDGLNVSVIWFKIALRYVLLITL